MFDKVLIANRGAIACRIMRTLQQMGVAPVCVYTTADADSRHVLEAPEAVLIGEALAAESYLDVGKILAAAKATGATAIHPGYGFLSENASFAEACAAANIAFIGPTPQQLREFGLKHTARALAAACGVPLLPGTGLLADAQAAVDAAATIGYPVMLKSTAGGGGIGMQLCQNDEELRSAFDSVRRLSQNNFADAGVFLEKFVARARHIEVQIFGDGNGEVISLGERDCSLQRRNQKVVEETPAPGLDDDTRAALAAHAVALGKAVNYRSAGTVEYVFDAATGAYYFLEVNTRLQVEHGVTEEVTGVDLVAWMVQLAAGELPPLGELLPTAEGHAIQVRLYAEDPARQFMPSAGLLTEVAFPDGARCDTWVAAGVEVSPFYDPMLAKIIVRAADREAALAALASALAHTRVAGFETNLDYLRSVVACEVFQRGQQTTGYLATHRYAPATIDVIAAGTETTIQDYPGRLGYWNVGIPPSGPMDALSFKLGNRLVGNADDAAGLELTVTGPTLRFNLPTTIALTGAPMGATIDGTPLPWWTPIDVAAGAVLNVGAVDGVGVRGYLAVRGGLDVPRYLGSRATFTLGRFGGHGGRALRVADVLHVGNQIKGPPLAALAATARPALSTAWTLRVIYGPHGAPDFFTPGDIDTFFATAWQVHYNSSRTGVRLIGPKPEWARPDGGEAGLHPSNLHDNAYAVGAIDFTGDMPVILGPDGPSLGGFVCPATVVAADRWCLGQLRPGDTVRFEPVTQDDARALSHAQDELLLTQRASPPTVTRASTAVTTLLTTPASESGVEVVYRPAGDDYLLVEFGPQVLDINLRFRVQALFQSFSDRPLPGVIELTPGIRSLQFHYDPARIARTALLDAVRSRQAELAVLAEAEVPSRIVHLPLSWDDPSTRIAIDKYMQSVRPDAPWCPSNIEFIRRINGLPDIEAVREIVFGASWLVMGLGDVYLGAPVATPIDPRHRLVTTKYNPARTWTPENAVGIGGSYLCVYGMEGPGGYQFVGRTVQMWNRYRETADFTSPWLLRFFDQIRFFPVSSEELATLREEFPRGRYRLKVEESRFSLAEYNGFLQANAASIDEFKTRQQAAFDAERARWKAAGQDVVSSEAPLVEVADESMLGEGERAVTSHVHGSVWQLPLAAGQRVAAGETLAVIESMKMEIALVAEHAGTVARVLTRPGAQVAPGQALIVLTVEESV